MENNTEIKKDEQNIVEQTPKSKKTKGITAKVVALALCCSLAGGALGAGGVFVAERFLFRPNMNIEQISNGGQMPGGTNNGMGKPDQMPGGGNSGFSPDQGQPNQSGNGQQAPGNGQPQPNGDQQQPGNGQKPEDNQNTNG